MRQTMVGLAVALAVAASAAPAAACGYSGCSSPSWNYNYSGFYGNYSAPVAPCPTACGGYAPAPYGATWSYSRLPYPAQPYATLPQYYYVNQGPTYSGPGMFAPAPTYQERAVSGWNGYGPTAYGTTNYSYSGGPYSNATTHYYDGMPPASSGYESYSDQPRTYSYQSDEDVQAPVYRPYYARPMYHYARPYRRMIAPRYYRSMRYSYAPRYNYAPRYRHHVGVRRYAMPQRYMAPRYMAPRYMAPRYMAHRYAPRFIAPRYVARPRMSIRYGAPQPMVRQGYAQRMGYAPMPPRRAYQPMYR
jgi:hypothetical protein